MSDTATKARHGQMRERLPYLIRGILGLIIATNLVQFVLVPENRSVICPRSRRYVEFEAFGQSTREILVSESRLHGSLDSTDHSRVIIWIDRAAQFLRRESTKNNRTRRAFWSLSEAT
jgi:hypothetical protein